MATVYSDRAGTNDVAKHVEKGVFSDSCTYTFAGEAAGTVLDLFKIAAGVRVLDMILTSDDLGTLTVDVGITGVDVDQFMDGIDFGAAGGAVARMGASVSASPFPYHTGTVLSASAQTVISLLTITGAATGTVKATVFLSAD